MNYIGSKYSILNFLEESINDFIDPMDLQHPMTFCDIFAGTGVVGKRFKERGFDVLANDIQFYSYVLNKHYIENNEPITFEKLKQNGINDVFLFLNQVDSYEGFIYQNYTEEGTKEKEHTRMYFTGLNAKKIDSIRYQIEKWYKKDLLSPNEYYYLLACLIEAADKVANTASVYEAFLKTMKKSAQKELTLLPLEIPITKGTKGKTFHQDCHGLIRELRGDILYLDPPYNSRKYNTNYHILETIALDDHPKIKGKTGVRANESTSKFNQKREALKELEYLIEHAKFRYIFLSYNDEGIISKEDIKRIMEKYGFYEEKTKSHRRYKSDNKRVCKKNHTIEYLHCLKKI